MPRPATHKQYNNTRVCNNARVCKAVWSERDGCKYSGYENNANCSIVSAVVSDGVADLSTGERDEEGREAGVFRWCTKLESVSLPRSLRKIGCHSFVYCKVLMRLELPPCVHEIGYAAFGGCESLKTLTIPGGVLHVPDHMCSHCSSLRSVKLPPCLKTIGKYAFNSCDALSKINFEAIKGVTEIGKHAFSSCFSLAAFTLPPQLKRIEKATFWGCQSLSSIELPPSLEVIEAYSFAFCHLNLVLNVPASVRKVEAHRDKNDETGRLAPCNTMGLRICLPTSVQFLSSGSDFEGLLHAVGEVVISSMIDVDLLVNFIDQLQKFDAYGRPFLHPDLRFKVIHCGSGSCSRGGLPPPIDDHDPPSTFSYVITRAELRRFAEKGNDLPLVVQRTYKRFMRKKNIKREKEWKNTRGQNANCV